MASITVNTTAHAAASSTSSASSAPSLAVTLFTRLLQAFRRHQARQAVEFSAATRASEAARVRRFASQVMNDDPRFAADLYAAADRHDRG